jgi:hypothetical protein
MDSRLHGSWLTCACVQLKKASSILFASGQAICDPLVRFLPVGYLGLPLVAQTVVLLVQDVRISLVQSKQLLMEIKFVDWTSIFISCDPEN